MFTKHHPEVGARPGTLAIPPDSPPPSITVVRYDAAGVERHEDPDPKNLGTLHDAEHVTWIDVRGLGDEDVLWRIADAFDLHPLALEDAVNVPQRAKSETYEQHQLLIARTPLLEENATVGVPQVCFVLGKHYLVTFQERYFGFFDPVRARIQSGIGPIWRLGPDYLAYALIDAMVDRYYPVAQRFADSLAELEDIVCENTHPEVLARIHLIRRQLAILRRVGWPQREALGAMIRVRTPFISEEVLVYLRDTQDHIAQIVELIDSSKEMASDLADAYLSAISHRSNEIMKVLTLMASIFIPLTFVAGIYGMNFEFMPELKERYAYFVVWGVMLSLAAGMFWFFRRRGWIGLPPPPNLSDLGKEQKHRRGA